jgi:hypothetical protein
MAIGESKAAPEIVVRSGPINPLGENHTHAKAASFKL